MILLTHFLSRLCSATFLVGAPFHILETVALAATRDLIQSTGLSKYSESLELLCNT